MNITEKFVFHFYRTINISSFDQLSISYISEFLDINVRYWEFTSELTHYRNKYKMFINEGVNERRQWQDFGHEMEHYVFDEVNQRFLPRLYVGYQESKADYFAYHFCIPTFMLAELKGVDVYDIMNLFNVEFDFAIRRMEMYKSQIIRKGNNCVLFSEGTR